MLNKSQIKYSDLKPIYNAEFKSQHDYKLLNTTKLSKEKMKEIFIKCRDSFKNLRLLEHVEDD